jgi:hypothetical protein
MEKFWNFLPAKKDCTQWYWTGKRLINLDGSFLDFYSCQIGPSRNLEYKSDYPAKTVVISLSSASKKINFKSLSYL